MAAIGSALWNATQRFGPGSIRRFYRDLVSGVKLRRHLVVRELLKVCANCRHIRAWCRSNVSSGAPTRHLPQTSPWLPVREPRQVQSNRPYRRAITFSFQDRIPGDNTDRQRLLRMHPDRINFSTSRRSHPAAAPQSTSRRACCFFRLPGGSGSGHSLPGNTWLRSLRESRMRR